MVMEETLRRLDELALELKLLTTEMREKGPVHVHLLEVKLAEMRVRAGLLPH